MNKKRFIAVICAIFLSISIRVPAYCNASQSAQGQGEFDKIFNTTPSSQGVRYITHDQLMKIFASGEKFVLVDVLSADDYKTGHIAGAVSIPIRSMSESYARTRIPAGSRVIVYCNGFECHASSQAAQKLTGYGYKVLDYKGGLEEWQSRGGKLVK